MMPNPYNLPMKKRKSPIGGKVASIGILALIVPLLSAFKSPEEVMPLPKSPTAQKSLAAIADKMENLLDDAQPISELTAGRVRNASEEFCKEFKVQVHEDLEACEPTNRRAASAEVSAARDTMSQLTAFISLEQERNQQTDTRQDIIAEKLAEIYLQQVSYDLKPPSTGLTSVVDGLMNDAGRKGVTEDQAHSLAQAGLTICHFRYVPVCNDLVSAKPEAVTVYNKELASEIYFQARYDAVDKARPPYTLSSQEIINIQAAQLRRLMRKPLSAGGVESKPD